MKRKPVENVSPKIHVMREQKVILDSDLAILYGVETKVILQAMRRNLERFPQDFVFVLSDQEVMRLRSQIVTSNIGRGGRRNNPYAFTEHGVAMLSTVLKSERAVRVSIEIIRMFVKLRQILLSDDGLVKRVESLEEKTDSHARAIIGIIRELEEVPGEIKQTIGFAVEEKHTDMEAISRVSEIEHLGEKLFKLGAQALLDHELIATILGLGVENKEAQQLATEVVEIFDRTSTAELFKKLCEVQGIGDVGAGKVLASLEFARRRRSTTVGLKVSKAADLVPWISYYAVKQQEHFLAVTLNGANEVISLRCVSVGLVNCTQVHPREVFVDAISDRACSIIVAHNHPSGELKPSNADIEVTKRLVEAGKILGIAVLDHIILNAKGGYLSLRDEGCVWF